MNIYKNCPILESERYLLRPVTEQDCEDLLKVYSDERAVPLFNSDNCNGDDFHYTTVDRMMQAIRFWIWSYDNGWFVRWSVVDKAVNSAIGTVELCRRDSENSCILRLDLRSDYENETDISQILLQIVRPSYTWFGCERILTKAKPIARNRIKVLTDMGFAAADQPLAGHDGTLYGDYYVQQK